jgi:hypothetical protein
MIHIIILMFGVYIVYLRIRDTFEMLSLEDEEIDELMTLIVNSGVILYISYLLIDYTMRYIL